MYKVLIAIIVLFTLPFKFHASGNKQIVHCANLIYSPAEPTDTTIRRSKSFRVNGTLCYWEHYLAGSEFRMVLKKVKADSVVVDTGYLPVYLDTTASDYFKEATKACLQDLNFDGYRDFNYFYIGSNGAMSDYTDVLLYNPHKKRFESSDTLSVNRILRLDPKKRALFARNEYRYGEDSIIIYFDRKGKIETTEEYSNFMIKGDTVLWQYSSYTKTVRGIVTYKKRDSVPITGE